MLCYSIETVNKRYKQVRCGFRSVSRCTHYINILHGAGLSQRLACLLSFTVSSNGARGCSCSSSFFSGWLQSDWSCAKLTLILHVFRPEIFLESSLPKFWEVGYKTEHTSDHVRKFYVDRPRNFGDLAMKKKKSNNCWKLLLIDDIFI